MATFYILPPRAHLEDAVTGLFAKLLPGLPLPVDTWDALIDRLASIAGWPADVYLIPRDDLPPDSPIVDALIECFGAEPGDQIVEVVAGGTRVREIPGVSAFAPAR
jgi:hypothetical protein